MNVLEALVTGLSALVLVPMAVLAGQVLLALPPQRLRNLPAGPRPGVTVLIPAHDEALVISETLRSILPQLAHGDRLLLVADNCSDGTAEIAASAGAEVLERSDRERRGKGYALDFGVRHLRSNPPQVVIIVDADCQVAPGSIDRLARISHAKARPVQALDLMLSPAGAGLKTRIAEFAWVMKNHVRPLGYRRLGLPCHLMGTGMAFPWQTIERADLANGHIVEDMKLGIDLAVAGMAAEFCPQARVTSVFPSSKAAVQSQRTRWEHGHLDMMLRNAPRLWREAVRQRDGGLLALALDLCVPPLALLALLTSTLTVVTGTFALITEAWLPFCLAATAFAALGVTVMLAWWFFGRQVLSLSNLAYAPLYALWKIPLYLKFVIGRQIDWIRSPRDHK
jgi:cellulose synthase/poly-beta-1,6-N-acetylglucosamine synthase-like glycosyltransferase